MKAILIREDRSLAWTSVPEPTVKPEDALIEIWYAGVNRADLMQRAGTYPPPPGAPKWMGLEVSGVILALGEVAAQKCPYPVGTRVCALLGGGGYAERVAVRYDMLMPVPDHFTMREAACAPEAFATSYLDLVWEGGLKKGDTVLITGGNSGLASVAIPMAKYLGARVLTTIRDEKKRPAVERLMPDRVINTKTESLAQVMRDEDKEGHGVDIALDCIGGSDMGECLTSLARGGRWIQIASLAGRETRIDLTRVYARGVRLIGSTLRSRPDEVKARLLFSLVERFWPAADRVRPAICAEFPIEEAEAAQDMLSSSLSQGKVVLKVHPAMDKNR